MCVMHGVGSWRGGHGDKGLQSDGSFRHLGQEVLLKPKKGMWGGGRGSSSPASVTLPLPCAAHLGWQGKPGVERSCW